MEVDQRLQRDLSLDVLLVPRLGHLLAEVVERADVGLVVLVVVQLHDLARDMGFERAVVIWNLRSASVFCFPAGFCVQGRSGSVAFPRTKVVPARPAREAAPGAEARSTERKAEERNRVDDMVSIDGLVSIGGVG